ncbi:hypothetical protein F2Q69_00012516 [Brassica cretica]|uniref:Uncharacterized protein n=1 Tax=Brassica cretica TaxID=69181 RepID=A0A8S9QUB8_BRACR|nr:hypothetical protein F2Q69_00012516 [Brassica cretica]
MFFKSGFGYAGSLPDDFQKVVWTSWKSSGLPGRLLTKSPFHNRSERFAPQENTPNSDGASDGHQGRRTFATEY